MSARVCVCKCVRLLAGYENFARCSSMLGSCGALHLPAAHRTHIDEGN